MLPLFHSVALERQRCKGCTNCIKGCPTEAIRVRAGKAVILAEKCIDCGECIRTCPNHAKVAVADEMSCLKKFTKTIALPAPSLFGQFPGNSVSVEQICQAIKLAGFDEVFLVAEAADQISVATWLYAEEHRLRPLISLILPGNRAADPSPILRTNSQSNQTGIPRGSGGQAGQREGLSPL